MMEQRTLDIIHICKGNTKYNKRDRVYEAIRDYMAEESMVDACYYSEYDVNLELYNAMRDYLNHCDKPSFFMWNLQNVMHKYNWDMYHAIAVVFSAHTQVKDNNGNYVNGFDDRLHKLDREELK